MSTNAAPTADKVAVVVIHGMGEQRPMETLRGFVESLWERDPSLFDGLPPPPDHTSSSTWSKPDRASGSAELRRITTGRARSPENPGTPSVRADFFELHWADITSDSNWDDFRVWMSRLLLRNPFRCEIPERMLFVWLILWVMTIAVVISGLSTALSKFEVLKETSAMSFLSWDGWTWVTIALILVGATIKGFLTAYFGDVARYVSASPRNIKVRQATRERGLKLIRELHATGEYLRIVIVGHSLGSILAHDLVALAWAEASEKLRVPDGHKILDAIAECEVAGVELLEAYGEDAVPGDRPERHARGCECEKRPRPQSLDYANRLRVYRQAQRELFNLLSLEKVGKPGEERPAWLISDLVTLGSPLAHASFLVAQNGCELQAMVRAREVLRSPPVYEEKEKADHLHPVFTYRSSKDRSVTRMHHAAALAAVRWTNLHDTSTPLLFLRGDLISGPISIEYGPGVLDLHVQPRRHGLLGALCPRLFTHTLYWSYPRERLDAPTHIQSLRDAVNILADPHIEESLLTRKEQECVQLEPALQ